MNLWYLSAISSALITAVRIGSCVALLSVLPILFTGIHFYLNGLWRCVIMDTKGYMEWDRMRKEWNKKAAIESRRQQIMVFILLNRKTKGQLSREDYFRYAAMVRILMSISASKSIILPL